jgi:hypothetical protein
MKGKEVRGEFVMAGGERRHCLILLKKRSIKLRAR